MKVIGKCVNDNLINELNAYLRHQRICQLALWGKSIEDFEPTEAEKAEYEQIRTYVAEEEAKARTEGIKSAGLCRLALSKCMSFTQDLLDSTSLYDNNYHKP